VYTKCEKHSDHASVDVINTALIESDGRLDKKYKFTV